MGAPCSAHSVRYRSTCGRSHGCLGSPTAEVKQERDRIVSGGNHKLKTCDDMQDNVLGCSDSSVTPMSHEANKQ